MNWFTKAFTSTLGRKLVMALTGLFLCLFLVVHVSGNFQLFKDDGGFSFNMYSVFMTHNPLIKTVSYLLYATFIIHIIQSLLLTIYNKKARPQGYVKNSPDKNSAWSSRNMGILGTIILVFLVIHMKDFWWEYHNGEMPKAKYVEFVQDGEHKTMTDTLWQSYVEEIKKKMAASGGAYDPKISEYKQVIYKDLYAEVAEEFKEPAIVILYLIAMIALAFHLLHGFQSAWQSLGVNHRKYVPVIKTIGWFFSIAITAGFAAMPLYFFLK